MTADQAAQIIAYQYSNGEQLQAIGRISAMQAEWLAILAIMSIVFLFLIFVKGR